MVLTFDIEGQRKQFTYWDYDEDFENAERREVFDQLQRESWYAGLDHPTKMEILDAAYRAIRGLEPAEYKPSVGDEPMNVGDALDEQGVQESDPSGLLHAARTMNRSFIITADLAEGGRKRFRVHAQSERTARERFARHYSRAKIVSVEEVTGESLKFVNPINPHGHTFGAGAVRHDLSNIRPKDEPVRDMPVADTDPEWEFEQRLNKMIRDIASSDASPEHKTVAINALKNKFNTGR